MTRLFVAIWPPADVVSELAAPPRPHVPGVRWSAPDQWMVKVRPFGQVADRLVEPLGSSPTGRAHTTSGSTTWLSFDWVGDGSSSSWVSDCPAD
jgi:hypothetical protein